MEIRVISIEDKEYIDFVNTYGTVFDSREWLSMFKDCLDVYGVFNGDELMSTFFLYKIKLKRVFDAFTSPFFTPSSGFIIKNEANTAFRYNNTNKKILILIAQFVRDLNVSYVQLQMPDNIIDCQPFIWSGFAVTPKYSYLLDLSQPLDVIYDNINPKTRSSHIQKAQKDGVEVIQTADYRIVRSMIVGTFGRQNKSFYTKYIDKILFDFANQCNSYACVAYLNNIPLAAIFIVYDKARAYCLMSGFDDNNGHRGAGSLVHYAAIKHAKELGIPIFDFEGSMLKPIEVFYRNFGGKLVPKFVVTHKSKLLSISSIMLK